MIVMSNCHYLFPVETENLDDIENDDNRALIAEIKRTFLKSPSDRPTMESLSAAVGMLSIYYLQQLGAICLFIIVLGITDAKHVKCC